jgi:hypothetical protein
MRPGHRNVRRRDLEPFVKSSLQLRPEGVKLAIHPDSRRTRIVRLDAVIFGGGAAGLWLVDELARSGRRALLLESRALGDGQTAASQGIIHGGLKYTLQGLLTPAAAGIRDMPAVWRECLAGLRKPDLSKTRLRSQSCYLWRTDGVGSRIGMIGARLGLRVAPRVLDPSERPAILAACPGTVARLDEQVISPTSFLEAISAPHRRRVLKIDAANSLNFQTDGPGRIREICVKPPGGGESLVLFPETVVLAAGAGNAELRRRCGLAGEVMQRRPLHMVLLRGRLPELNGHCVDGARTRVTITSECDAVGRVVWQVGGQVAEDGVALDQEALLRLAVLELRATIPGIDLTGVEGTTYRVDRAEGKTESGKRPETMRIFSEGNVITAWPTKLALAPQLAREVSALVPARAGTEARCPALDSWPRPAVARPPWESCGRWHGLDELESRVERAA